MYSQDKIILMTELALYDKNFATKDKKTTSYFLHDYIYKRNSLTRFFVYMGVAIIILFYIGNKILVEGVDILSGFNIQNYSDIIYLIIVVTLLYTIASSIKSYHEYKESERRLAHYLRLLNKLDNIPLNENKTT